MPTLSFATNVMEMTHLVQLKKFQVTFLKMVSLLVTFGSMLNNAMVVGVPLPPMHNLLFQPYKMLKLLVYQ